MSKLGGIFRLICLITLLAVTVPVQMVFLKFGFRAARNLPIWVYRMALRILRVRVTITGEAPNGTSVLVVSNHVSWLDIPVIGALQPTSFIAKAEIAKWPVFGFLARVQRSIFIDRERRTATAAANDLIANRLTDGGAVILFAEGTTGDGLSLLPFRSALIGAAHAAIRRADSPAIDIKPLALRYTHRNGLPLTRRDRPQIAWYGDMELIAHLWDLIHGGPLDVTVSWCETIALSTTSDRKSITAQAEAMVRAALAQ